MIIFYTIPPDIQNPDIKCKFTYGSELDFSSSSQPVLNTSIQFTNTYQNQQQSKEYKHRLLLIILVLLFGLSFITYNSRIIKEYNNILNITSIQYSNISLTTQLLIVRNIMKYLNLLTLLNNAGQAYSSELTWNTSYNDNLDTSVDFAHYTSGAHIIPSYTSQTYKRPSFGVITNILAILELQTEIYHHPVISNFDHNSCWLMKGNSGQIAIKFGTDIVIHSIIIQYPREGLINITAAPKDIELWGWRANESCSQEFCNPVYLTSLRYNRFGANIQQFWVNYPDNISAIMLVVIDNWGAEKLTCIYQIKVFSTTV